MGSINDPALLDIWQRRIVEAIGRPLRNVNPSDLQRFFLKVQYTEGGCWLWHIHSKRKSYGRFSYQSSGQYAHRVMAEWAHGPIAPGQVVCHHCDTPACVNPAHLFVGTHFDNMRDRDQKGRGRSGKRTVIAQEEAICADLRAGKSVRTIAKTYNVTRSRIRSVARATNTPIQRVVTKLSTEECLAVVQMVREGKPFREIAKKYALHFSTISHIAQRYGVVPPRANAARRKITEVQEEEICNLLRQGIAKKALARQFGLSPSGIRDIAKRNNVTKSPLT